MRFSSGALSSSWLRRVNRRPSGRSFGSKPGTEAIALTAPVRRVERHDGALAAVQPADGGPLRGRVERRLDVVALALGPGELVDERAQLAVEARQLVVVGALEAGSAEARERVADRVGEEPAGGVRAAERLVGVAHRAGEHRPVGRADQAAPDLALGQQRALVLRVGPQLVGPQHRPARREHDEHAEEQREHDEQAGDRRVHRPYSRRARSETSSSSASSTKLARIDEPP